MAEKVATSANRKTAASGYCHPRTGDKRKRRMPLRIDRLPQEVRDAITTARATGQTWKETAKAASAKAGIRLSSTTVHRWYDLRVEHPQHEAPNADASLREIVRLLESILLAVSA